ncbi:hypothetical protein TEA_001788 [Camellia sinensis var. sinensis]|uniref:GED domain-containing protein n=1 Tax=Camellia sinensis var. sinensis TaxID=542762 RepID=A0A4S4DFY9_CAMSN|nr:hypothetical protein TEA_001788 [Camellia sinensis var. sinensis]
MVDGKSQEMSTKELSGGARIHYIFQSIFVKSLEEVNPCEDFSDEDIRTAIQNATGPRNALFVPEVPFQVLVRRQIARLLDPSLQCLRLVYDELIKMSRACEAMEIRRFPVLRRRLDEVMGKFLRDGVKPAERMIGNIIEMEMDYINSSHPNFIGGKKAMEEAMWKLRSSQDDNDVEKVSMSEKGQKSRVVQAKSVLTGVLPNQGTRPQSNNDRPVSVGNSSTKTWAISSIFGSRASSAESSANRSLDETVFDMERMPSVIQLREPPAILRPSEAQTDNEAVEIIVTKLLLSSYYDIVRKNIQDFVPKAIMHFLVNHTKRDLLNTFIQKLYSIACSDLFLALSKVIFISMKLFYSISLMLMMISHRTSSSAIFDDSIVSLAYSSFIGLCMRLWKQPSGSGNGTATYYPCLSPPPQSQPQPQPVFISTLAITTIYYCLRHCHPSSTTLPLPPTTIDSTATTLPSPYCHHNHYLTTAITIILPPPPITTAHGHRPAITTTNLLLPSPPITTAYHHPRRNRCNNHYYTTAVAAATHPTSAATTSTIPLPLLLQPPPPTTAAILLLTSPPITTIIIIVVAATTTTTL